MLEYDVVVVGGGPVGGFIAGKIAEKKYRVAIFEKNKQIGEHLSCAGLITPRVFNFLNIPKKDIVQNKIKGAYIHSPLNKILAVGGDKIHALAIDRLKFDKEIINLSKKLGAELYLENNVLSTQKNREYFELTTSKKIDAKCKLLIGADGPNSKTRDRLSFPSPKEFLRGISADAINVNLDPNYVEIFVGKKIAPGFFVWVIPTNKDGTTARIGLCVDQKAPAPPKYYFSGLLKNKQFSSILGECKITRNIGGIIPLGVLKKTFDSNVMFVGDAAAQVKPTSGGGIYPGLLCGNHCSTVAIDALGKNDFSSLFLSKYQKLWMDDLGFELKMGMRFRAVFKNLSDKQFDKYIEKFQNPKIVDTINKYGDIDYPSKLMKPLFKKIPLLIKLLPNVIKQ